ncbi:MAG: CinA family protein [SAR324 cluster bacterium]|nr:CinA family protein [SAR324 cluster bacterium]
MRSSNNKSPGKGVKTAPEYDLQYTAFLLLTGNPSGFHHLMMTELVLRQFPEIKRIVLILSNGKHPDPTKTGPITDKNIRLEILQNLIREFNDPQNSCVAQIAEKNGYALQVNAKILEISTIEFEQDLIFRIIDHLGYIRQQATLASRMHPIKMIIGADLIHRMNNPQIFTDADLGEFKKSCEFLIIPREDYAINDEIEAVQQNRKVELKFQLLQLENLPPELSVFLQLSSTQIRKNVQAGHDMFYLVSESGAKLVKSYGLYSSQSNAVLNEWEVSCWNMQKVLAQFCLQVKQTLDQRAQDNLEHLLAFVETSSGGNLSAAFSAIPGASVHLSESVVAYSPQAKQRLLKKTSMEFPAVSEEMAQALAKALKRQSNANIVVVETGMASPPDNRHHSPKNGECYLCVIVGRRMSHRRILGSVFLSKREHQLVFAIQALNFLLELLRKPETMQTSGLE